MKNKINTTIIYKAKEQTVNVTIEFDSRLIRIKNFRIEIKINLNLAAQSENKSIISESEGNVLSVVSDHIRVGFYNLKQEKKR